MVCETYIVQYEIAKLSTYQHTDNENTVSLNLKITFTRQENQISEVKPKFEI